MTILDRYLLRALTVNYVIALAVMMSLYIVLDLFFNMDEFTEEGGSVAGVLVSVVRYYWPNLFLYFAQLSGVITLAACVAALARMRRLNELTAMLASGVSLFRVAAPVIGFGVLTTLLWLVDIEFIVPRVAAQLARSHEDARGERSYGVWFLEDGEDALLSAQQFEPSTNTLRRMMVLKLDETGTVRSVIEAEEARWEVVDGHPAGGHWALSRGVERVRVDQEDVAFGPGEETRSELVNFYESDLDPQSIQQRQSAQWVSFLSSGQLRDLSKRDMTEALAAAVQQARHRRFATPIINLVLLLLGIPFLLDRAPGSILSDLAKCVLLCGTCFAVTFASHSAVSPDSFSALPSWLPIILFVPVGAVLMDRIRT
jgi:lipopolysaccharide export system permease protein